MKCTALWVAGWAVLHASAAFAIEGERVSCVEDTGAWWSDGRTAPEANDRAAAFWHLAAASDLIVRAGLILPDKVTSEERDLDYATIRLTTKEILKGDMPTGSLALRYYDREDLGGPTWDDIFDAAHTARPAILFLAAYGEEPGVYYFADHSRAAILPHPGESDLAAVKKQIDEVATLSAKTAAYLEANKPPLDDEVAALIEKATVPETAVDAVCRLLYLGSAAAPAMIRRMDDRRPIPLASLTQSAWPGNFEGWIHYQPKTVEDLIELALSRAVGTSFGGLHNGGNELQRRRAVEGWRTWLGKKMDL